MIVVTTNYIEGKRLEMIGLVRGSTIQTRHLGKDIGQSLKHLVGGELKTYTEMMNSARDIAIDRMIEDAKAKGAHAIVSTRLASSAVTQGAAEVIAYGTAVKIL